MTAVTFSFNLAPAQGSAASQSIPPAGSDAAIGQQYQAVTAQMSTSSAAPAYADAGQGPGVTTLSLGEEDGGTQTLSPSKQIESPLYSSPVDGGNGFDVTTLAIGEEDGGMSHAPVAIGGQSGGMSPIQDNHSIIGGYVKAARPEGSAYGSMQPIYSPGEPEYSAFAKASQGPELLNFTPVPRAKPTSVSISYSQPVGISPAPVDAGNYVSVGSYEAFASGGAATGMAGVAPAQTTAATVVQQPQAPAAPEMIDLGPLDSIMAPPVTEPTAPAAELDAATPETAPVEAPVTMPEAVHSEPVVTRPEATATEPPAAAVPEYIEVPLESYTAPAQAAASTPAPAPTKTAPESSPAVKPAFEPYLAPATGVQAGPSAQAAAPTPAPHYAAPDVSAIPTAKPSLIASVSPPAMSTQSVSSPQVAATPPTTTTPAAEQSAPAVSMGGSYVVFEGNGAGAAESTKVLAPAAEVGSDRIADNAPASDELRITTLAIGEEDGLGGGTWQP